MLKASDFTRRTRATRGAQDPILLQQIDIFGVDQRQEVFDLGDLFQQMLNCIRFSYDAKPMYL